MRVILKRDVKGLGHEGDLKEVKVGYARNFLLRSGRGRRQGGHRKLGSPSRSARGARPIRARRG
jgi:hypothetical protein